jgi:GDP-L-fucose synthase
MNKNAKIWVAGHRGLVGSEIYHQLQARGYTNLITRNHKELDLINQYDVHYFFQEEKPEYIILAAALVGGIWDNKTHLADFCYQNMMIQNNVIHNAFQIGVKKLLFLGSSCIYPRDCEQPIKEDYLLSGPLEPSNEGYAIAKISGLKLCQYYNQQYGTKFISCMPSNIYGSENDNYDLEKSHVLPALLRKFHEARVENKPEVVCWGTGSPKREFIHVSDVANACLYLMDHYEGNSPVNIGLGKDISIKELTEIIAEVVGYKGKIVWDTKKPDGTPRKLLDTSLMESLGWRYKIRVREGIENTYRKLGQVHPNFK